MILDLGLSQGQRGGKITENHGKSSRTNVWTLVVSTPDTAPKRGRPNCGLAHVHVALHKQVLGDPDNSSPLLLVVASNLRLYLRRKLSKAKVPLSNTDLMDSRLRVWKTSRLVFWEYWANGTSSCLGA